MEKGQCSIRILIHTCERQTLFPKEAGSKPPNSGDMFLPVLLYDFCVSFSHHLFLLSFLACLCSNFTHISSITFYTIYTRTVLFGINVFGIVIHVHEKTRNVLQGILLQAELACGALGEIMEIGTTGVKTVREELIEPLQHGDLFMKQKYDL